jgi:hypothetical protein
MTTVSGAILALSWAMSLGVVSKSSATSGSLGGFLLLCGRLLLLIPAFVGRDFLRVVFELATEELELLIFLIPLLNGFLCLGVGYFGVN